MLRLPTTLHRQHCQEHSQLCPLTSQSPPVSPALGSAWMATAQASSEDGLEKNRCQIRYQTWMRETYVKQRKIKIRLLKSSSLNMCVLFALGFLSVPCLDCLQVFRPASHSSLGSRVQSIKTALFSNLHHFLVPFLSFWDIPLPFHYCSACLSWYLWGSLQNLSEALPFTFTSHTAPESVVWWIQASQQGYLGQGGLSNEVVYLESHWTYMKYSDQEFVSLLNQIRRSIDTVYYQSYSPVHDLSLLTDLVVGATSSEAVCVSPKQHVPLVIPRYASKDVWDLQCVRTLQWPFFPVRYIWNWEMMS